MTKLVTVSDVRDVLRFDQIDEIDDLIDSALEVATADLENMLRQDTFTRKTSYDIFLVKHSEVKHDLYAYHWRLTRGFVDSGETFTIKVADQISDFGTDFESDITDECQISYEKGVASSVAGKVASIRVAENNSKIIGNFVRIDYTSGFNETTPGLFDDDEIPSWLKQAAIYRAIAVIDSIDPELRASGDSELDPKVANRMVTSTTYGHIRYFPKYEIPVVKI